MKKICAIMLMIFSFAFIAETVFADQLTQEECDKKKEGWYVTGLPLINFSSDTGVGYGVRLFLYNNGARGQDYFCNTPYLTQVYAQFFQTTLGKQYHEFHWDQYRLFGTNLRLSSSLIYEDDLSAHYYGLGSRTTRYGYNLGGVRYGQNVWGETHFSSYASWRDNFLKYQHNAMYAFPLGYHGYYKYNMYQYNRPQLYSDLYGQITDNLRFIVGIRATVTAVRTWNGRSFSMGGHKWYSTNTQLSEEQPTGIHGGWANTIRAGIAYYTLDFEPDPTSGMNIDYSIETSQKFFGSSFAFWKHTFGARYYLTLFERLTLATRLGYTTASGDIPFYEMSEFTFPYSRQSGLGGNRTLRGYPGDRFVGKTMTLAQLEARLKIWEISGLGQRFVFKIAAFFDAGNVYDNSFDPLTHARWGDYKWDIGGGLIIAWNQATIIHVYYTKSREDTQISIDFNHAIR
jgi:hypothetical protein